jgi:hypothetical protein
MPATAAEAATVPNRLRLPNIQSSCAVNFGCGAERKPFQLHTTTVEKEIAGR